ncbi:MAG TPA: carboxypeptidase-like regulatory domain-containing protein, partial [Chitinophagaceae bacterium]|nr:carboxypeptidase-like regulatory domain-containing protein [Chitinophagaceae bacterium]
MYKRKLGQIHSLILFLLVVTCNIAKSQITIQGSVSDSLGEPIRFTSISLQAINGQLVNSALSDSTGFYKLELTRKGNYKIQFSSINYYSKNIQAYFSHDTTININLKKNDHYLQAIEITSRKPIVERKIDRVIYNIQN